MMTEKFRLNGSEVIDNKLTFLLPIFDATSAITIIFTLCLIGIIITKTPSTMKTYETYLLPYAFYTLLFELSFGAYSPRILHPYFHFYPAGYARFFPAKISKVLLIFGFYCSMSLYDCCIAMILERYYAMTKLTKNPSKIPFYCFCFLSFTSMAYLIFMVAVVFYGPLDSYFAIPEDAVQQYLSTIFVDLDKLIDTKTVLAFANTDKNQFSSLSTLTAALLSLRVFIALAALLFSQKASRTLKNTISSNFLLHKCNLMLLRMTNLQFFGVTVFLFLPLMNKFYAAFFLKDPCNIINYTFAVTNFFGLYDAIVTAFFIKPYRVVIISFAKKYFCFEWIRSAKTSPLSDCTLKQHEQGTTGEREKRHHDVYFVGKQNL